MARAGFSATAVAELELVLELVLRGGAAFAGLDVSDLEVIMVCSFLWKAPVCLDPWVGKGLGHCLVCGPILDFW